MPVRRRRQTPGAASEALDGPRSQKIRDLESIIEECKDWGTPEAAALAEEAAEYLEEIDN